MVSIIVARVPEALTLELMKDGRVLRRPDYYRNVVRRELTDISMIDTYSWQRLADMTQTGMSAVEMFNCCFHHLEISEGYIHRETFSRLEKFPWSLAVDDIPFNLLQLKRMQNVEDPFAL